MSSFSQSFNNARAAELAWNSPSASMTLKGLDASHHGIPPSSPKYVHSENRSWGTDANRRASKLVKMDPAPFYPKCKFGTVELLRACPRLVGQVPALAGLKDFIVVYATTSQNADTLNIVFPAHHDSTSNLALADYVTKRLQEAIEEFSASTISAMGTPEMVRATSADASEAQVGIGEFQTRIDQIDESTAWMTSNSEMVRIIWVKWILHIFREMPARPGDASEAYSWKLTERCASNSKRNLSPR
jgi:hypothetical protein